MVEYAAHNGLVVGSNPTKPIKLNKIANNQASLYFILIGVLIELTACAGWLAQR